MGDIYTNPPQSRNEAILRATIDGTEYTDPPQSRIEDLLIELKEAIDEGGGSVESYEQLTNKPQINGTTLSGDKSTEDLIPIDKGLEFDSDGKLAVSLGNGLAFNSDGEIDNLTEANPSDSATGELSKLKVGSDIYSIVTKAVNDLANYYTKSDVYTKTEVNNIAQARFAVVAQLPTEDIQTNVIYLVPKSTAQTNNDYDEYIYALKSTNPDTYGWEKIGDTEIDLSDYVTTQALNTALANYTTTTDLTTLLAGKQNTLTFDSTPTAQSTNPVTSGGIKTYVDAQGAKTASGNPITLTDAEAMNANHVIATITPTQTGSGTPSPTNVRPFTGFSSVEVTRFRKNLYDISAFPFTNESFVNGAAGSFSSNEDYMSTNGFIPVSAYKGLTLTLNKRPGGLNPGIAFYSSNNAYSFVSGVINDRETAGTPMTFTVPQNANYMRFTVPNNATDIQIEINNQATTYEPYQGQTYTIQLGDTYYGGTLDVTSGKLIAEWKHENLKDYSFSGLSGGGLGWYNFPSAQGDCLSNKLVYNENAWNSTVPCFRPTQEGQIRVYGSNELFATGDYADSEILYKLATSIEIQLTPQQIALLENNNTITTNVSSLDITYQTNTAIGDTASALDKRVTSLESKVPQPPTTDGTYKLTVTVASGEPTYSWESAT